MTNQTAPGQPVTSTDPLANRPASTTAFNPAPPVAPPISTPMSATAEAQPSQPFRFTGSGAEYFKIWIVNILLTIVTLGIYSAWAKVRRLRYFYNNTKFAGSNFDFHGSPIAILKGRIIGVVVLFLIFLSANISPILYGILLLLFLAALPWLVTRSLKFHMANSSYRNLRFRFLGETKDAYVAFFVPILALIGLGVVAGILSAISTTLGAIVLVLVVLAFYAVGPYIQYRMRRFSTNGARAGTSPFSFHVTVGQYYIPFFIALAFMIVLGVIFAVVFSMFFGASIIGMATNPTGWMAGGIGIGFFVFIALFYLALLSVGPLLISLLQNTVWSGTALE
ncbi:MAG: YjgN family protein, partial [Bacteroidia bacterium]